MKPKILLKPPVSDQPQNVQSNTQPVYIASQEFTNRAVSIATPKLQSPKPEQPSNKNMTSPVDLFNSSGHGVNVELIDYLRDNVHFRVITVLGRGNQKCQILNSFLENSPDIFSRDSKEVQLFITSDRRFIVNVNMNSFHKMGREGDLEKLSLYISLLKFSHSIIFSEGDLEARECVRWLRYAECMDFGYNKLGLNLDYVPMLIFIGDNWKNNTSTLIRTLFKGSKLQNHVHIVDSGTSKMLTLSKLAYQLPSIPMSVTSPFTEQNWYQIVLNLFKLHKTNYFLVKYGKGSS